MIPIVRAFNQASLFKETCFQAYSKTTTNPTSGTTNAKDIEVISATYPIHNGPTAPPIGVIIKKDAARFV